MLNRLRKGAKSLTAKVLIALLVASFAVWGIGDIFNFRITRDVAKVGSTSVSAQQFSEALSRQQTRLSRRAGKLVTMDQLRQAGIAGAVLGGLVRDAAFTQELKNLGLSAPDSAVAKSVRDNKAFDGPDGKFSKQIYEMALQQQGMNPPEFESLTRTVLAQQILVHTVKAGVVAPPGVAARIATYRNEKRGANIMALTLDMAPDPGTPTADQLKAYYDKHKSDFAQPERRSGEYLHVDAEKLLPQLQPSEKDVRAAYESNKERYKTPETRTVDQITFPDRKAAEQAVSQILSGATTFDELSKKRGLSQKDIELGKVKRGDLPPAAEKMVFAQAKPGIIGPVELPAGFAVYRLRAITPAGVKPYADVHDQIANQLAQNALQNRAPEIANKIEELRAAGKTMKQIAKQTGATYGTFDGLAQDGTLANGSKAKGIVASKPFIDEVFAAQEAEERNLLQTDKGGYFLVMVNRINPSHVPPLKDVHDKAVTAWQHAQRLEALKAKAGKIAKELGQNTSIWDIGKKLKAAVLPLQPFTRIDAPKQLPRALVDRLFRVKNGEGAFAASSDGKRVVIAQVSSVTMPTPKDIQTESKQIDGVLANSIDKDIGEYYARAVMAEHHPQIHWDVVDKVFQRLGASSQPGQ